MGWFDECSEWFCVVLRISWVPVGCFGYFDGVSRWFWVVLRFGIDCLVFGTDGVESLWIIGWW